VTKTILVVDDDYLSRELLQAHLENVGYHVRLANNGEKALAIAVTEQPDLILMDVNMPGLTGYSTCALLKESPQTAPIPILLMTAMDDDENIREAKRAGADGFVAKPLDVHGMLIQIEALTERS